MGSDDSDESLDPVDWDSFRALAHAVLDDAVDYVRTIRERPVWTPVPESVQGKLAEPLPVEPQGLPAAYRDLKALVLPYPVGNLHPRDEPAVDLLNDDVIVALQESGVAVPSATRIRGHLAIRANLTNHRTRREDLDLFARSAAEEAARRIAAR